MNKKVPKRKKRHQAADVSETVTDVLRKLSRKHSGVHPEIWSRWSMIVGEELAKRTIPEVLRNKTLFLAVKSSSWLQELSFLKPILLERLADAVGPETVTEVRLVLNPELVIRPTVLPAPPMPAPVIDGPLPLELECAVKKVEDDTLRETIRRAASANLHSINKP